MLGFCAPAVALTAFTGIFDETGAYGAARIAAGPAMRGFAVPGRGPPWGKPSRPVRSLVKAPSRMVKDFGVVCAVTVPSVLDALTIAATFRAGPALMAVASVHRLPICARSIRPEPVQNPSGVCQGYETARRPTLTQPARNKPVAAAGLGFRLMPVSLSVKVWSKCFGSNIRR